MNRLLTLLLCLCLPPAAWAEARLSVINFWASDCSACLEEIPRLIQIYHEFDRDALDIMGVAAQRDSPDAVQTMARDLAIPYPIAWDRDGQIAAHFKTGGLVPLTLLVNTEGQVLERQTGLLDAPALSARIRARLSPAAP